MHCCAYFQTCPKLDPDVCCVFSWFCITFGNLEVFDAKRLIGRKFADPIVQADIKLWPFKCVAGQGDKPMIIVNAQGEAGRLKISRYEYEYLIISQYLNLISCPICFQACCMLIYILYSTGPQVSHFHTCMISGSTASCDKVTIYNLYFQFSLLCRRRSSTQRKSLP